ncbi:transcription antitermination factor NusB [Temperatibacter marinus]|uniref:Transcription antitermination protein NusB n=1 Tax=Temperatibacter marinus TaxID=1456591 RepID=A0AA52EH56_9PROT|nr:transcription antitermination factor NusB [Temperatibacter marinus]WND02234.1 transcription antitermination factor NusB [Temperatibacter marinus]
MAQKNKSGGARSAARLAAVQATYQLLMSEEPNAVLTIDEYKKHRLGKEIEGIEFAKADEKLFSDVVEGTWNRAEELNSLIGSSLKDGWSTDRLEKLIHAILLTGAYELSARPDVPTAVIITEYVDVTHAFCERQEASFVNGVLDKIGKTVRS